MISRHNSSKTALPAGWPQFVKSAMLHILSLAQYAATYARRWAADRRNARRRLRAQDNQLRQLVGLLKEEFRILGDRLRRIPPSKGPYYLPTEHMSIFELRAARAWSILQTAAAFLVTSATIASWMKRLVEHGPD